LKHSLPGLTLRQVFRDIVAMISALNTYLATGDLKWLDVVRNLIEKSCGIGRGRYRP
jgi:hypothetical protein